MLLAAVFGPRASAHTPSPASGETGPAMLSSAADRNKALTCKGDLDGSRQTPVLLVPGTSLTPMENWGPTYRPVLLGRGYPVCMVALPAMATKDIQVNIEYVATAIEKMAARAGRKISMIGVSQGGLLSVAALRTWPQLGKYVDDVIGLAGVYDRGSRALVKHCKQACLPVLRQMSPGSAFLTALHRRPLPKGPSFTNIGTEGDQTVTPQPSANWMPGAKSIMVQDACPWRDVAEPQHAMMLGDSVALQLVLDALEHDGVASPGRLPFTACWKRTYAGFDLDDLLDHANHKAQLAKKTKAEPALFCRSQRSCRDPELRGRAISTARYTIGRKWITIRAHVQVPGRIRVVVGKRVIDRAVSPGLVTLRVRRPAGAAEIVVETRPQYFTAWAVEATKSILGRP